MKGQLRLGLPFFRAILKDDKPVLCLSFLDKLHFMLHDSKIMLIFALW